MIKKILTNFSIIFLLIFLFPTALLNAAELNSASYKILDSSFGAGAQMNSTNFSVTGAVSQNPTGLWATNLLPLVPGTITSCGKITQSGTYTLNSSLSGISSSCFLVQANNVIINGQGYTVNATGGNTNYAVMATSSSAGGSGYSVTISNINFSGFAGGVNANGANGINGVLPGGNGGYIVIASSTLGNILSNGGSVGSGYGGAGGSISITGVNIDLATKTISVLGGSGTIAGGTGSISVSGSVLVQNNQVWSGNDSSWLGSRTWEFAGNSYNAGTVSGVTTFDAYTASSSTVTINGNSNFHGSGVVNGTMKDSVGSNITTWNLINNSVLTGTITGNIIFNDGSYNTGTVLGNSIFNDSSYNAGTISNATFTSALFNSISGIPNADPTGISNGHTVSGTITFSATSSSINFSVNTGSIWNANTTSWNFTTPGQNWTFSFANNTGTISGDTTFSNSINSGRVNGISTFQTNSHNSGITATSTFYSNSYNIGTSTSASFYNSSVNSHSPSSGVATARCDFFDSALPGTGHCPVNGTFYHIPYYYNSSVSTNWNDLGNWWFDPSFTQPAGVFPQTGDTVFIGAQMDNGPSTPITLGNIYIASSITGGGSFSVNLTNASGPAYFYNSSTNAGVINGTLHVFGNRSFSQVNVSGTYTGDVVFHGSSWNDVSIVHNAIFYDTSYNSSTGVIGGNAEFHGINRNDGHIIGSATVISGAILVSNGAVDGGVSNSGIISGGIFNNVVINVSGVIAGTVTNLVQMIFNGGSSILANGYISGDAMFNSTSSNNGIVNGTSTFNDSSYNIGTTSNATFVGDLSENIYNGVTGFVSGIKTRLYTAFSPQINFIRDFTGSSWTIVADNTIVKLLYTNLIDIFNRNPNTTTTLVERNGGVILRPLATNSPVTSCGILDTENGTYTLGSDISNYLFDTCFIIRADGVTLDGAGHSVTASSSISSLYAVVSTSTLNVDATSSAFTNLTIKNIKFVNFTHGLLGVGNNVPNGVGGDGSSVNINHVTIEDINVSGGDPTERAGNGGNLNIETSTTTVIVSDGGISTACGIGGNGGNISITTDTVFSTSSNKGGEVYGCPPQQQPMRGSSGQIVTSLISQDTQTAITYARNNAPANRPSGFAQPTNPNGIFNIVPNIIKLVKLDLKKLPSFGDSLAKGSFSFLDKVFSFIFSSLPQSINDKLGNDLVVYLKTAGFSRESDITKISKIPMLLPNTDRDIPGLFKITTSGIPIKTNGQDFVKETQIPVSTYFTSDANAKPNFKELITVLPKTNLNISLVSTNTAIIKGKFNGKDIVFDGNNLSLTAPAYPGTYTLTTSASPLSLIIKVKSNDKIFTISDSKPVNFLVKILNFFWPW